MDEPASYQIIEPIGRGQFGQVFRAINRQTGQIVALKQLDRKQFPTNRFLRELSFLVMLDHPNIVQCHSIEYSKTGRYLVMDFFEGGSLRHFLTSTKEVSLLERLQLICHILQGLEYIHSKKVIHRDLKPENILLKKESDRWVACISDFGISKWIEFNPNDRLTNNDTGSPAYMSPEQFRGEYSFASDIYAVGIILFELVVGVRPFSGLPDKLRDAHLNEAVVIPETVSFVLRSTIAKALQKLPQKRFKSATEMLTSLKLAIEIVAANGDDRGFGDEQKSV
ncbi:MAG: serine/threonine-protein kinase [Xenococcaceae cyanobacterium]